MSMRREWAAWYAANQIGSLASNQSPSDGASSHGWPSTQSRISSTSVTLYRSSRLRISLLSAAGLRRPAVVIDPVIDHSRRALGSPDSKTLLFVGAFARGPNAEGARWFIREVWPSIHGSIPGARLLLAGAGSDKVLSECPAEGADATGYMADLKLAYDRCAIAIAPLMRGAGLKFKVPQALAYGLPVVTTTIGAEGMPLGCPAIVTDTATKMAGAIIGLLQAPEELRRLGEAGRTWATGVFDFSRSMDDVERRFEELLRRS